MESRSPYPKLWKEWRSYKIVLLVIRSPPNYSQYLAKWDPKRGVTPICTFRYVRSGTQILHHVPGSFGNPFSKKLPWFLSILIWKKRNIFLKIFCSSFSFVKKKLDKNKGGTLSDILQVPQFDGWLWHLLCGWCYLWEWHGTINFPRKIT